MSRFSFSIAAALLAMILSRLFAVSASHLWREMGFSIDQAVLDKFEVPYGAHAVNYLNSTCGDDVPFPLAARVALMCGMVERVRANCTQDKETPVFLGRDCRGQTCDATFHRGNSTCLLQINGETMDLHNKTLAPSCGISTNANEPFKLGEKTPMPPQGSPLIAHPDRRNCGKWLPEGVTVAVRTECENGEPEIHLELTFDREMPAEHNYTCGIISGCPNGVYGAEILCFVDVVRILEAHPRGPSSDSLHAVDDPFLVGEIVEDSVIGQVRFGGGWGWLFSTLGLLLWMVFC